MTKIMFLMVFVVLFVVPMVSYADSAQECGCICVDSCSQQGSGMERMKLVYDALAPQPAEPSQEGSENNASTMLAQNANYIPCYKQDERMKMVLFRWCPNGYPWTATSENRTGCYATSEACAAAEMPQSWCIKCGN